MSSRRHIIIVGPQGSGKSLRAHELSQLAGQPTWTLHPKGQWPRRVAAPTMIVTTQALPAGWSAPDHIWRVIELIPAAA